ncbi:hypothetical protein [Dictyobacter alpinus]|uniref:hypothetical protein n=1 Tax=Dictyobacter alpinus TaxID=2014873 RepID=UPI0013869542|nr:hypothetical protein [Dictyobacter alpinus]
MSHLDRAGHRASLNLFFLAATLALHQQRHSLTYAHTLDTPAGYASPSSRSF